METEQTSNATPPPVVSYPEFLPLDDPNLPWERFEAFCEELISKLPGVKETHRYGRSGSGQGGIDIFADLEDGERWAFQCRQWKKFTKTDATKAIRETSYQADRFILMLSRQATSGVRDACDGHPNWDVWDVGDISRKVREMSPHSRASLVEAHLGPAWRKSFLGLSGLTPFVVPAEFFYPFSNKSALFNHTWQIVGRSDHIRQTHEFVKSQQQNVAILAGRGGIGKSKILHALAESFNTEHQGMSLWFMAEGVSLTQDGADHLPYRPCVVVVDDAQRRVDLPALLALSRQRPHVTKLILTCRPEGVDYLRSQLTQGGFDVREVVALPDVKELSREEVTELGRQALGPEYEHLAEQLTAATWDCPLVTVVGGQLLAQRAIAPDLLERDDEFRNTVLTRFGDVLVGEVGDRMDKVQCRSLLELIAAIQPIRLNDEKALDFEAEFLGIGRPTLIRSLGILEEVGVLLRRGNTLRIVPDVLADHILHQVSVTPQGQKTGYADNIFNKFASLCPSEVLRNLSELDWRLRKSGTQDLDLLGGVWQSIEQEFQEASNQGRCTILGILEKVAVYQPVKTLGLVEYAIRNPATKSEDPELSKIYEFTHSDVLHRLPALLRRISYTLDVLPRCCNLLWELGRDDNRDLNPIPDHPMRVLSDIASYGIGKPFLVNHLMLDIVGKLLEDPSNHEHVHSPLDIIDPMLKKTGDSSRSEGHKLVISPFVLKKESIEVIRQRSIALAVDCLSSHSLKVTLRALRSLEVAMREPVGIFGIEISDEDQEQWRPEQLEVLTHIANLAQNSTEPIVHLRIRRMLQWHCRYSESDKVRAEAGDIVATIPDSFELRLTQALIGMFYSIDTLLVDGEEDQGDKHRKERIERAQQAIVAEFLSHSGNATTAHQILTDRLQTMRDSGAESNPQVFLGILGAAAPELAAGICDRIVDGQDGVLEPHLHALLSNVRIWNSARARAISRRALGRESVILCRGVAESYRSRRWADSATPEDIAIIKELLGHQDLVARGLAIGSIRSLAGERVAIDLVKNVDLEDSTPLAIELCWLFYGEGLSFSDLVPDDLKVLLSKLEEVPDIEDFCINAFLVRASEMDAMAVARFLLSRIGKKYNGKGRYHPLPLLGFDAPLVGLAVSPEQERILREVRDMPLEAGQSVMYWAPRLFREVSSDFKTAVSLRVLGEWINSESAEKVKYAAHLVSGAQPSFVFEHVEFTSNLLERAHAASLDTYESVSSSLASSAHSGGHSGTVGQPLPQDVAIKEQASAVARRFDTGSPAHRFYTLLAESAEAYIRYHLQRDEEEEWS